MVFALSGLGMKVNVMQTTRNFSFDNFVGLWKRKSSPAKSSSYLFHKRKDKNRFKKETNARTEI
ncbi:hypothetical protein, partial [Leptospira santarosai]|uniref:hypothetical protein n=1 Tax=Leptospira santarosai TaxID=28183 RepID=UPI001F34B3A5